MHARAHVCVCLGWLCASLDKAQVKAPWQGRLPRGRQFGGHVGWGCHQEVRSRTGRQEQDTTRAPVPRHLHSASVVSDSVRPHRRQPTRLRRPWDSPGKNTGVGCHFLLQCLKVKSESPPCSQHRGPWLQGLIRELEPTRSLKLEDPATLRPGTIK